VVEEEAKVVVERGEEKLGREMIFSQLRLLISPPSRHRIHPYL
jgi:hypothetical protein